MPKNKSETCVGKRGPLTAYSTESKAAIAANRLNLRDESQFVAYQCSTCGEWHLSPAERHTPSKPCEPCGKNSYETKKGAERRAKIGEAERGVLLNVYRCPKGNGWHLTSKVDDSEKLVRYTTKFVRAVFGKARDQWRKRTNA